MLMQFNTRFLLGLTLAVALAISMAQAIGGRYPLLWVLAMFAAFVIAMYGLVLLILSAALAVSILTSAVDVNRGENLRRCARLAGVGAVSFMPLILWSFMLTVVHK